MLTVSRVTMSFAGRVLFSDASLQVNANDRIGLIGANGAGKSTLFRLIRGELQPDAGKIEWTPGVRTGFLPQESAAIQDFTVLELASQVTEEVGELQKVLRAHPEDDAEHHEATARLAEIGLPGIKAQAKRILSGLAFRAEDMERSLRELSGGWVMRAHLARLLVMEPEVLLLDEPTNHLDLESLGWFQDYLCGYRGAILAISHDRGFLNAIAKSIVEISRGQLVRYTGNYEDYLAERAAREEQYAAAYRNQQREIAHLEAFVERFRAKNTKAAQAQDRLKRLERIERLEAPTTATPVVRFRFPQPARSGHTVMWLENVEQAYGERVVYSGLNLELVRGERIVLVGPNGAGKSTLLKILAGVLPLRAGTRVEGHNVSTGYFTQQRAAMLNECNTVLGEAQSAAPRVPEETVRSLLGAFLFRGDDVFKPVSVLSGGEKSRLGLVKILLNPPNFLLLDEPTTHLDIPAIDALICALQQFEGTLVFVSHDVHFIRATANRVFHIEGGRITPYAGGYDYFLEKTRASSARGALVASLSNSQPRERLSENGKTSEPERPGLREIRARRRAENEARKKEAQERRALATEVSHVEQTVIELERKQEQLLEQLQNPAVHLPGGGVFELNKQLAAVTQELETFNNRWEQLAARLSEMEQQGAGGPDA